MEHICEGLGTPGPGRGSLELVLALAFDGFSGQWHSLLNV